MSDNFDLDAFINAKGKSVVPSNKQEFTPSEFMLLIGNYVNTDNVDTGATEPVFIKLPAPLYLDSMKQNKATGEKGTIAARGNKLLEALLAKGLKELKPGESKEVNLRVLLYRKQEEVATSEVSLGFEL